MKRVVFLGSIVVICVAVFALLSVPAGAAKRAADPKAVQQLGAKAGHLMDSGVPARKGGEVEAVNTLNPPVATPFSLPDTYLWYGPPGTQVGGGFMGNCFDALDIPSSWYPLFRVTGAWAHQLQSVTGTPTTYNALAVGVNTGVWPGGGTVSSAWAAFTIANSPYHTGLVGGRSLWGTAGAGGVAMTTGKRMAVGLLIINAWGNELGLKSGAGAGVNYCDFGGPPIFLNSFARPDSTWLAGYNLDPMAGAYVAGATVPVELQSIQME